MAALVLLPLLGFILLWRRFTNSRSSSAALHASSAILVTLYFGALCGLLRPVSATLLIAGTLLVLYEILILIRKREPLPVPIGVLLVLCGLFILLHHDTVLRYYDEYSHWGIYVKELVSKDGLWGSDSNAMHLRYLPGAALWQYFFLCFNKGGESGAFFAQFCLLILPLLVLWQGVRWHQVYWILAIFAVVALALSNFGHGFVSLYVDHLLGAWFAGTLFNFMLDLEDRSPRQLLSYTLPLSTLVLIKDAGLYFAAAAIGIMALLVLTGILIRNDKGRIRNGFATVLLLTSVWLGGTALITFSWDANRDSLGIPDTAVSSSGIISGIATDSGGLRDEAKTELTRRFLQVVAQQQISKDETGKLSNEFTYDIMPDYTDRYRLTTASSILLFGLWQGIVLLRLARPGGHWRWAIGGVGLILTTVVYLGVLLLSYRFAFDVRSLNLPSYVRYAHTALLPMLLFVFLPLLPGFGAFVRESINIRSNRWPTQSATLFAVLLCGLYVFETPYLNPLYETREVPPVRAQLEPLTETMRDVVGDARLWIFMPVSDPFGLIRRLLRYQMTPVRTEVIGDPEFLMQDPSAFDDVFANWDFLWFPIQDPRMEARLTFLFGEDPKGGVYRVVRSEGKVDIVALDIAALDVEID